MFMGAPGEAFLCFGLYLFYLLTAKGYIRMTAARVKKFLIVNYLLFLPFFPTRARFASAGQLALKDQLGMSYRCVLVVMCADSALHTQAQFALSLAEVAFYMSAQGLDEFAVPCVVSQAFMAAMASTLSVVMEYFLRQRLAAQFRSADAESITCGFRRMLRGICDGDVLLNGSLVVQDSTCLNRLSAHDTKGTCFPDLLECSQEVQSFRDFMGRSVEASTETPTCLRVSLPSASGARVGVDVFHVALPYLHGSDEVYHLLALREDADVNAQSLPDATPQSLPAQLLANAAAPSVSQTSRASSMLGEAAGMALLGSLPQLSEIVLAIDPSLPGQNIKQLHLKYHRSGDQDGMPCMRRLIRPTDWESVPRLFSGGLSGL